MGIFNFFKKRSSKIEADMSIDNDLLINKSNDQKDWYTTKLTKDEIDITNQNNDIAFDDGSNNTNDYVLFSDDDYKNDFSIDTSYYDALINGNNVNSELDSNNDYNIFNLSDDAKNIEGDSENIVEDESENVIEDDIDYEFHKKENLDNDLDDTENNAIYDVDNIEAKKEKDLFAYLDDPFLVDDFINRDTFSFQKFLDDKKKQGNENENLVDLDDEEQRLQFITEIENNIIDHEFQKSNLIDSETLNAETHEDTKPSIFSSDFGDVDDLVGDELYREQLPSSKIDDNTKEEEIILDEIIIPTDKIIEKAPTNNFRDFLEIDTSPNPENETTISNPDSYNNNHLDDPLYVKDYLKNNSSLHHMENYTKEETNKAKPAINNNLDDVIEDFYDDNIVESHLINPKKINDDISIPRESSFEIKEKMLINEIKQKYEKEIVMDAKRRQDEINKMNRRPNFNDELLDLIKKGFPN